MNAPTPETKEDICRRLREVLAQAEAGEVTAVAIVAVGITPLWQHSQWEAGVAPFVLTAGLEACKLDVVRHSLRCDCEKP